MKESVGTQKNAADRTLSPAGVNEMVGTKVVPGASALRLFHLTADRASHWGSILITGVILPLAEVPASADVVVCPHGHPEDAKVDRLVWLTTNPHAPQGWTCGLPKTAVWIEVDPARVDAVRWADYGPEHFSPQYLARLNQARFGNFRDWWVSEEPIFMSSWLEVTREGWRSPFEKTM